MCIHSEPLGAETARSALPVSGHAQGRAILLPLYPQMKEAEQDQVMGALREAMRP